MHLRLKPLLCRLLALLLLVNGAVVAAEVSAHGLCDHGQGENVTVHLHGEGRDHHDHRHTGGELDGDHLCHAHPPLCASADSLLPPNGAAPSTPFVLFIATIHSRTLTPPVPPPNA